MSAFDSRTALHEPGFIMYGSISNSIAGSPGVFWQVSSTSASTSVNSATINVNGQNFFVATVPFETRSISGVLIGSATPKTLPLNSTPAAYTRLAQVKAMLIWTITPATRRASHTEC